MAQIQADEISRLLREEIEKVIAERYPEYL